MLDILPPFSYLASMEIRVAPFGTVSRRHNSGFLAVVWNKGMKMLSSEEKKCLRDLAKRVVEIADLPIQKERRSLWKKHNTLRNVRPMILIFPEGSWRELLPESGYVCQSRFFRSVEKQLRIKIYTHEHFETDAVVEKTLNISKPISDTGWGLEIERRDSTDPTGAFGFKPTLTTFADSKKLKHPRVTGDGETCQQDEDTRKTTTSAATPEELRMVEDLLGDLLTVRQKGITHNACHMAQLLSGWRGLDQLYMDLIEAPEWVHEVMQFLTEGHIKLWKQYEDLGLVSLNNEDDYHSSGGVGYTDALPGPDSDPNYVRLSDVWGSAESQEMTSVSPEMHEEFFMKYEAEFLKPFALNGYGCCDDLSLKLDTVTAMPQMRRISVSPYAEVRKCAQKLQGNFILSWKPDPWVLVGEFDSELIRKRIRSALEAARDNSCVFEMILKDTHTCEMRPERFTRWSKIAREEVNRISGAA